MGQKTKSRKHYFPFLSSADIIAVSIVELNTAFYIFSNRKLSTFWAKQPRHRECGNIHLVVAIIHYIVLAWLLCIFQLCLWFWNSSEPVTGPNYRLRLRDEGSLTV